MVSSRGRGRRIIPAYAGSTVTSRVAFPTEPDHPRIRGEHYRHIVVDVPNLGSSPHTRGAPSEAPSTSQAPGGSSPHTRGAPRATRPGTARLPDHPRIRGEHRPEDSDECFLEGSSPHTRGALVLWLIVSLAGRIIPAYAGSTSP